MIHSEGNAIIVGKEMTEDILSTEQQQSILNSISYVITFRNDIEIQHVAD